MINFSSSVVTVQDRLAAIHGELRGEFPAIGRVAIALYEDATETVKTFVHSTDGVPSFGRMADQLSCQPAVANLTRQMERIITKLDAKGEEQQQEIGHSSGTPASNNGYLSSYTTPFYEDGTLLGFIFFDSLQPNYFSSIVINKLSIYSYLLSLFVVDFVHQANALRSAIAIARDFGHRRDRYTGIHLDRMAHYSRIIARYICDDGGSAEDFVDCIFLFAPLHDIGKIAIPDEILLKRGRLTSAEFTRMQRHVSEGVAIVETIIATFGIGSGQLAQMLKNIVRFHHERFDGAGYLEGLAGETIPLEARIISVADVFDALTGERPYRAPIGNAEAFAYLTDGIGREFDRRCVQALISHAAEVEAVQAEFRMHAMEATI